MRTLPLLALALFGAHCGSTSDTSHDFASLDLAVPADLAAPSPDLIGGGCPSPGAGRICVHGKIRRIIDDSAIASGEPVTVQLYDPLSFAADPRSPPLVETRPAGAEFVLADVSAPSSGLVVLVVRDRFDGVPDAGAPRWTTTAVALAVTPGSVLHADAWATWLAEAQTWSLDGTDYVAGGAVVVRYFADAAQPAPTAFETMPAAGVQLTLDGNVSPTAKYFAATLVAVPAGSATGATGAAIDQVDATPRQLSGKSSLPWETSMVAGVPGVILHARVHKH